MPESQDSAPPQPFNSSPAGWANRLWHFPGFVSSTWARAQITGLARPGFRGKGLPAQPGHQEVRQALIRGASPQRAPTVGLLSEVRCLKFGWPGQLGSGLRDAALAGCGFTQGYLYKFHLGQVPTARFQSWPMETTPQACTDFSTMMSCTSAHLQPGEVFHMDTPRSHQTTL